MASIHLNYSSKPLACNQSSASRRATSSLFTFLYLAPNNNTYGGDGKKVGFPLVLEKGESYSFVVSDKTQ